MLADPFSLGSELVEWAPPSVLPDSATLRAGRAELERTLQPGSAGHIAWCLGKMAKGMASKKADAMEWAMRTEAWADACGHFPDDLWSAATLELLQTKTYFPAPAEMVVIVGPKYSERQRMLERVKVMLGGQAVIQSPKPFVPEPQDVRLRSMIGSWRKIGRDDRAAPHELALAKLESRKPEAWALNPQPPDGPADQVDQPVFDPLPPAQQAALKLGLAKKWRERGNTKIADQYEADARWLAPELFTVHRDIPEAAHG